MPQALRVDRAESARGEQELQRLLVECRAFSGEFPDFLANHLPMVLVAMHRLGGSDERLNAFFATYRDANRLPAPPARVAPIARESWDAALGDRARERDYIDFFHSEVARIGARAAVASYLPRLLPGLAASATHGLMRLAYGALREDSAEIAIALGYWAATYLELGVAGGNAPVTDDPAEVLLRMRPVESFRGVETDLDLLWHFMRAMAAKPEFRPIVDSLAIGPGTAARMREASLALYAGTMDFCALHAVTGCHWLRMLRPATPAPEMALRYFWQSIAALYPKIGFPELPDSEAVEGWRRLPCPAWPEIEAAAVRSDDEHDLSLVFSAREEFGTFGDRLYQIVAARRMQLIP
ncbi:MAG: questin oxidase family protein [Roseiarcus sp.]